MKKPPFFLILLVVIISQHVHSQQTPELMRFVLQWPQTFCTQLNNAEQPGRCTEPILQHDFTLHGLWPSDSNGYPISCTDTSNPDWKQVFTKARETKLQKFWPSLREREKSQKGVDWSLWKHEWRVHGVCGGAATTAAAIVYFDTAININAMIRKGNLFNYLKTNGIIACDSLAFTRKEMVEAIQKVFIPLPPPPPPHAPPPPRAPPPPPRAPPPPPPPPPNLNVYLSCYEFDSKNKNHVYLNEVSLCTDLAGTNFRECPQQRPAGVTTCSSGARIMLPHPKPQPQLRFVLQWPPTFCIELNSQRGKCKDPIPQDKFTLNGLWRADGQGKITTCQTTRPAPNWNQVFTGTRTNQLKTFWQPLKQNSQERDPWIEQWQLHGCIEKEAEKYFDTAIEINKMFKQRNLFEYLKTSGIIASDTSGYSKNDIVVAIQKVFDNNVPFNVYLTCFDPKIQDGFVYLKEVTLCTDFFGTSFLSCLPQPDEGIKTCSVTGAKIRLPLRKPQKK